MQNPDKIAKNKKKTMQSKLAEKWPCFKENAWFLSSKIKNVMASVNQIEMFYLNSTLNYGILPVLVFQLEVYYMVDRLLTELTAQQKGTTAWWYSKKKYL